MRLEADIARLGAQGDGIAETAAGPIYIPFTLPGERVSATLAGSRGVLQELLLASPDRIAPICVHFGACGGCALQHLEWSRYLEWKRRRIVDALSAERIVAEVEPVRAVGPHSRRRVAFTAMKAQQDVVLGFHRAFSHALVDVRECPILVPRLEAALPALRELCAALLPPGEARVLVTACDAVLDVLIEPEGRQRPALSPALAAMAQKAGIVRIVWRSDIFLSTAPAQITLSGVVVDLPPGAFLQAVPKAEEIMARLVCEGAGKARRIADLFSGLGTFTFALGRLGAVTSAEADPALLAAMALAARRASGLKPITALRRDLMREPLSPVELNAFDAVVFDPPRAGAFAQAQALAKSKVGHVVAVSCNPATFARDARALADGGYALKRVVAVDQFVFSPHIELVASFTRK